MLSPHISIGSDASGLLKGFLAGKTYTQTGVLLDNHTEKLCYPLVASSLPSHQTIVLPAGEEHKTLSSCDIVWQKLTEFAFDRHSLLIILGGGVLGDLGGFCAATFKRGIDFVLMPTTLLAQCDASIGGKLAIDFQHYKNHIGLFQEPAATLISSRFLKTLPPRELRSGYAEIVKHCLISDRAMWDKIRVHSPADQPWEVLVRHSVEFKDSVIRADPKELGMRKILNFGHTVGHAIEGHFLAAGDPILHGEAIAAGMVAESFIAFKLAMLSNEDLGQIISYVTDVFGPFKELRDEKDILKRIAQDKKNQGKKVMAALPEGIGKARWDVEISENQVVESLEFLQSLHT